MAARRPAPPPDPQARQAWQAFQELPNIGPAMAGDLVRLGLRSRDDLARADPKALYDRLAALDGRTHDPCVLDTFEAAVTLARGGPDRPWWFYARRRKARQGGP